MMMPRESTNDDRLIMSDREHRRQTFRRFIGYQIMARTAQLTILVVASIFLFIFYKSILFFFSSGGDSEAIDVSENVSTWFELIRFFFVRIQEAFGNAAWHPTAPHPEYGMLSMIYGSIQVTIGAILIAVPVGITAAVVLSDVVPFRVRQIIKPIIELLVAVPSVAFGFFALVILAPWLQDNLGFRTGTNALNASLILAIMSIPLIISVADDALTSLGRELREGSLACGATRFETIFFVVV
ncbi:MAG: PstC family ABC transporter permease, partial [Thermoguttaceae bacterium]